MATKVCSEKTRVAPSTSTRGGGAKELLSLLQRIKARTEFVCFKDMSGHSVSYLLVPWGVSIYMFGKFLLGISVWEERIPFLTSSI